MLLLLSAALGIFVAALAALRAISATYSGSLTQGSDNASASLSISADGKAYGVIDVPAASTVNYTGAAGLPANLKAYSFLPDFAGTMTVNYASGADDVITLTAGEPVEWHNKMQLAKHLVNANAIVSIDFNNPGAAAGTVTVLIIRDDTP